MSIVGKSTGSDQSVYVWMQSKVARPGVENHGDAELGTKARPTKFEERVARGGEERRINELRPEACEGAELTGQREDDVKMRSRQNAFGARANPLLLRQGLALRAVPIPTGVVRGVFVSTRATHVNMPAERSGATERDRAEDTPLGGRHDHLGLEGRAMHADDVGNVEARPPVGIGR